MKKFLICLVILILLIVFFQVGKLKSNFVGKNLISAYDKIFEEQAKVDDMINKYKANKEYTLENPKVILNPYKIAPLTALIIFQTDESIAVSVKVNDNLMTKMESSKEHLIPIYGMLPDHNNKIELVLDNDKKKEIFIKTKKYDGDPITIEKTTKEVENNLYFISPNFVKNCIINGKGEVLWYIDGDYAGDIEYLNNGHFYISDPNQGTNGVKINYSSFLEIDYLGKIHKQWITEYGLHHELVPLSDNKMLVLGASDNSKFLDSYIYIMDLVTAEVIESIDLYDLLHKIDAKLIESLDVPFDLVNNSADYNEETGDLLISLRGLNSLMKLNIKSKEIKWIFGDPDFWGERFAKYMLKIKDNTRYLGGQHSAFYTKDGLIGVHNNDIDQFDLKNTNLSYYLDRFTTCDLYKVDEEEKTIETIWQYDADKKYFSNVAGHMEILDNNQKLITYGWAMTKEAYDEPENVMYTDPSYKNGVIIQLNNNDEVIFKAKMPGLIYRTFKIENFYNGKTKNYELSNFQRINGTKINGKKVKTNTILKEINKAKKFHNKVEVKTNRLQINTEYSTEDSVDIYMIGDKGYSFIYPYKHENKQGPKSFNSGYFSIKLNCKSGNYHIFVKENDKYYDTEINIKF